MSIELKTFRSINRIFNFLESLFIDREDYIFRGHRDKSWRLQSTLHRHRIHFIDLEIDEMINNFRANLIKIGFNPFGNGSNTRINWLEYARHYGVPTPCLDFTYSPYIALFFAFSGTKINYNNNTGRIISDFVHVYALNKDSLAHDWAYNMNPPPNPPTTRQNIIDNFLNPPLDIWNNNYPMRELFLIPYPSSFTQRIHRQQGLLLYDTVDYNNARFNDLEGYIEQINEPRGSDKTLIKIKIPKRLVSDVFERLELMGITGSNLFADQAGAQIDIMNSYYFNSKTFSLRDIDFDDV
jgi:hypothetical protein